MKHLLLFIAIGSIFFSCQKSQIVNLSGEIKNNGQEPLLILNYQLSRVPDTIKLENGKFSTQLNIDQAAFRTIKIGHTKKEIFLMPGFDLKISANAENVDSTFKIEGKGSEENNIHNQIQTQMNNIDYRALLELNENTVFKTIDSVYAQVRKNLEALQSGADSHFLDIEKSSIGFHEADLKLYIALRKNMGRDPQLAFLKNLEIDNEKNIIIPNYQMFLDTYFEFKSAYPENLEKIDSIGPDHDLNYRIHLISKLNNPKVKEYLVFKSLNEHLQFNGVKGFDNYLTYFNKQNTDSAYSQQMQKSYAKKSLLAAGKPAPNFTCVDKDSIPHSLTDFKGKYVFIDFWATWCGPCRQELPHYLKLQSDYKGKDIVFLSISVDDNKKSWLDMVTKNKAEGISLFGGKGWSSEAAKAYQVVGIPTFVLIDREGKILDSQAPRPSSNEIRELLDRLLAK